MGSARAVESFICYPTAMALSVFAFPTASDFALEVAVEAVDGYFGVCACVCVLRSKSSDPPHRPQCRDHG